MAERTRAAAGWHRRTRGPTSPTPAPRAATHAREAARPAQIHTPRPRTLLARAATTPPPRSRPAARTTAFPATAATTQAKAASTPPKAADTHAKAAALAAGAETPQAKAAVAEARAGGAPAKVAAPQARAAAAPAKAADTHAAALNATAPADASATLQSRPNAIGPMAHAQNRPTVTPGDILVQGPPKLRARRAILSGPRGESESAAPPQKRGLTVLHGYRRETPMASESEQEVLRQIAAGASEVRAAGTELAERIKQFEAWLNKVPGRVEAQVEVYSDPNLPTSNRLALRKDGKGWSLFLYTIDLTDFEVSNWRALRDASLEDKIEAVRFFPQLLTAMADAQKALVAMLNETVKEYDGFAKRVGIKEGA